MCKTFFPIFESDQSSTLKSNAYVQKISVWNAFCCKFFSYSTKRKSYNPLALEQAILEGKKEIEAIANNPAPATFENTIAALDNAGELCE